MTAKQQYEHYNKAKKRLDDEFNKGLASLLLKMPMPMSYEIWQKLHEIIGDKQ